MIRYTWFFLFFGFVITSEAQDIRQTIIQPSLNLNKKVADNWKLNMKIESRQLARENIPELMETTGYEYVHTDIALLAATNVGFSQSLAGGLMLRAKEGTDAWRLIQQYAITTKAGGRRLSYRLASDQTFESGEDTEIRLRGRIATDFPLFGESVDAGEFYIKASNEYLSSWEGGDYDVEIRLSPSLGYEISKNNKVELGGEFRYNGFFEPRTRSRFFIGLNWYVRL